MAKRLVALASTVAVVALAAACSGGSRRAQPNQTTTSAPASGPTLVFNDQGKDLAAYLDRPPFTKQIVVHHNDAQHPHGLDVNGQICFDPHDANRFVAGEDTKGHPGEGVFEITDPSVDHLRVREVGKLVPTYQPSDDAPENYGCGFLDDGRVLTTDVGNQATGAGDGQLIVWFPPFDGRKATYCKVDVHLYTGRGILVDGDSVFVSQSRPPHAGVYSYAVKDLPTSNTASGGCDGKDDTGAPQASHVRSTLFIAPSTTNGVGTPAGIAKGPNGHLYIASVYTGVIAEFTGDGSFVRDILKPPPGQLLGPQPFSTGTPLGVGVAPDGSVYYADVGIVSTSEGIGPGPDTGTVRRITFDAAGIPRSPETMDRGLSAPDGIGIWNGGAS